MVASDWADGMSASLRAGISAIESGPAEYAVLITVDTPDIGAAVVRRVLAAARTCSSGLARAGYGERPGHPVVVARRHWPDLVARAEGDEGGRAFLQQRTDVAWVDCADLASGADIDVNPATVMPSAAAANRRTACVATSAASAWPSGRGTIIVAAAGSSVTSATTSPVVGSHTSQT